jgi:tetratricopeptide (TPR) repeat protein
MNSKLQNKLVDKYPKIFLDDKRSKILCWGIECPDSWYHILEALCFRIQQGVDNPSTQIKKTIIGFLFGWIFKLLGIERKYFLVLNKIVQKDGIEAAIKAYMDLKNNQADEYNFAETELNMLGYRYIALGKKQEAAAILKINMEQFTNSWNANDSYADALREIGQNEKAIKYYKKSLELNPDNSNGINMLKKLAPNGD